MAAAFGRYVNLQQGEADQLTEAAEVIFRAIKETSPQAPDMLIATLCKESHDCCIVKSSFSLQPTFPGWSHWYCML